MLTKISSRLIKSVWMRYGMYIIVKDLPVKCLALIGQEIFICANVYLVCFWHCLEWKMIYTWVAQKRRIFFIIWFLCVFHKVSHGHCIICSMTLYQLILFLLSTETAQFLSSPDLYEEIVEMSALLFLRAMSNESSFSICEYLLCQGILDNDAIRGHLCLDIWRLFVRYVEVTRSLWREFKFHLFYHFFIIFFQDDYQMKCAYYISIFGQKPLTNSL